MGKINAFVYRDGDELYLVPLVNEKRILHMEELYAKCDNGNALKEESIALCWHEEIHHSYKTIPTIIVDLTYDNAKIKANRLKFDDLVTCAYNAAIIYSKKSKIK
jgi:hypothetical protein